MRPFDTRNFWLNGSKLDDRLEHNWPNEDTSDHHDIEGQLDKKSEQLRSGEIRVRLQQMSEP